MADESTPELSASEQGLPGAGADDFATDGLQAARRMWAEDAASSALGMELLDLEVGRASVRMTVTAAMVNGHEIGHGGYLFTLADSAFALACNSHGPVTVAAGADIVFVGPVRLGDVLVAQAVERRRFGRSGITDVTVAVESVAAGGDEARAGTVVAEFRGRSRTIGRPVV